MITSTSLMHPKTQSAIRMAIFGAAANPTRSVDYAERADGSLFMRVDYMGPKYPMRFYGAESRRVDDTVYKAMASQIEWVERLADTLARPGVEKTW